MTNILGILTGATAGFAFGILKLPLPAPPTIPGLLGILGLYLGYIAATKLRDLI
jgi:XapX domain-containing protein